VTLVKFDESKIKLVTNDTTTWRSQEYDTLIKKIILTLKKEPIKKYILTLLPGIEIL
jgi:hypothetical protein